MPEIHKPMRTQTLLLTLLLVTATHCFAQKTTLPQFPGGETELNKYIKEQAVLPISDKSKIAQVSVLFLVGTDGSILRPTIATSYSDTISVCEDVALEIVKQMPQWLPGTENNVPLEMAVSLHIDFRKKESSYEQIALLPESPYSIEIGTPIKLPFSKDDFLESYPDKEGKDYEVATTKTSAKNNDYGVDIAELESSKIATEESPIGEYKIQVSNANKIRIVEITDSQEYKVVEAEAIPIDQKPFVTVEQMPSFPGGESELNKFIDENLMYPVVAQEMEIKGRVFLRFIVETDGTLSDIHIVRGLHPICDKEAIRLMSTSPKWIPGKQNGEEVRVYFTIPIIFRLNNTNPK